MTVRIGLCGSHGSGKTTLVQRFGMENLDLFRLETNVGAFLTTLNVDVTQDLPFKDRLEIQIQILDYLEQLYKTAPGSFITDRTPIDVLAYTFSDITRTPLTMTQETKLQKLYKKARLLNLNYFEVIALLKPSADLSGIDKRADRAPLHFGYVEHISALCTGFFSSIPSKFKVNLGRMDIVKRSKMLEIVVNKAINSYGA